jgi:electron transfer flavoprotein alpha subunit
MSVLVFVESAEGKIKKTSLEAVAYAHLMGQGVTAIALGDVDKAELEALGTYGAQKVLHAADSRLNDGIIHSRMNKPTYWCWQTPRWELP